MGAPSRLRGAGARESATRVALTSSIRFVVDGGGLADLEPRQVALCHMEAVSFLDHIEHSCPTVAHKTVVLSRSYFQLNTTN